MSPTNGPELNLGAALWLLEAERHTLAGSFRGHGTTKSEPTTPKGSLSSELITYFMVRPVSLLQAR